MVVEAYDTDAYGNTLLFSGPGTDGLWFTDDDTQAAYSACRYVFTGREYDAETENYFYRARYYAPNLGRFLTRDPLQDMLILDLYAYARNAPNALVDPSGLRSGGQTDDFGTFWPSDVDWLHHPKRKPNGAIPGMGFPPGDPNYNKRPNLEEEVKDCRNLPQRPCSECEAAKNNETAALLNLNRLGRNPIGTGIAGAGKGIVIGSAIKGGAVLLGSDALAEITGTALTGTAIGPIGTIGGAAVGLAKAAAGFIDSSTAYQAYKAEIDSINAAYDLCTRNCANK